MKLTQKDIDDIAKGYHNKYVEAQDKDELIKYLASKARVDEYCEELDVEDEIDNIESAINDIQNALDNIRLVI